MPTAPPDPPPTSFINNSSDPTNESDNLTTTILLEGPDDASLAPSSSTITPRQRRRVCGRCSRPCNVCICSALPAEPIRLESCHCVVLQHPRELERKNRSLPFLQLSLDPASLTTIVSRRLHSQACPHRLNYLLNDDERQSAGQTDNDSNVEGCHHCWLIFPSPEAISLSQALRELDELVADRINEQEGPAPCEHDNDEKKDGCGASATPEPTLTVLFLDGTWQLAREMFRWQEWDRFRLVQLDSDDFAEILERPCRYPMRTPPTPRHLSTHECISYVLSRIEHHRGRNEHPALYQRLLQPLDLAVQQYQTFLMRNNR